ncbi:MAG: hypothetical protein LLG06_10745 [Desulfobacteraceae bacterium]|nr:hypothetical protein [Desulfobacteraceae bacterium]
MKSRIDSMRQAGVALAVFLAFTVLVPCVVYAVQYELKNFLILVDDQLIMKGNANVNCCQGAPFNARSDLGSRNSILLGGIATTNVPVGAPNPAPPVLPDVAVIAPKITLKAFAKVSMAIFDQATGAYSASGSGVVEPLPGHLYDNMGNNPLNDTGSKSLPGFPNFPTITPGTTDVVVPAYSTLDVAPGDYRDLIIGAYGTVNFTGGAGTSTYQFRRIIANTASRYSLVMQTSVIRILVAEFVHLAEFGSFNPTGATDIQLYVGGLDSSYGGANKNKNGVTRAVGTYPAAFQYGGDGGFDACFVFVKNGTMNLRGTSHEVYATQWFGNSLQEISNLNIVLEYPSAPCLPTTVQCACITDFAWAGAGKLLVYGVNLSTSSVGKLAVFSDGYAQSLGTVTGGDVGADQLVGTLDFATGGDSFTTQNNMQGLLTAGLKYNLGIIYPFDPVTGNVTGYCIFTDRQLKY